MVTLNTIRALYEHDHSSPAIAHGYRAHDRFDTVPHSTRARIRRSLTVGFAIGTQRSTWQGSSRPIGVTWAFPFARMTDDPVDARGRIPAGFQKSVRSNT